MIRKLIFTATSLIVFAGAVAAQTTPTPATLQEQRVDNREARQSNRIDQGVASGEITPREKLRLERQQNHVQRLESGVEADGTVTRKEAFRVEKAQDRASRNIARQKHDRQTRP